VRDRIFNRNSTGPHRLPRSRRYIRRIREAHLLRAQLRERRTHRRCSIGKKSSCSSIFLSGESARRTCRNEPTNSCLALTGRDGATRNQRMLSISITLPRGNNLSRDVSLNGGHTDASAGADKPHGPARGRGRAVEPMATDPGGSENSTRPDCHSTARIGPYRRNSVATIFPDRLRRGVELGDR